MKTCPFKSGFQKVLSGQTIALERHLRACDGKDCQLWVNIVQNRVVQAGHTKFADPDYEYRYEGCGLLQSIPWNLVKREEKQNANATSN